MGELLQWGASYGGSDCGSQLSKRNPFIRISRQGQTEPIGAGLVPEKERDRLQRENLEGWRAENPLPNIVLPASADPNVVLGNKLADQAAKMAFDAAIELAIEALGTTRTQSLLPAREDP